MALYKFLQSYRGINKNFKNQNAEESKFKPEFYNFKKDDIVNAEEYKRENIQGVKFQQMMIVAGSYIVPAKLLEQETESNVSDKLDEMTGDTNEINLNDIDSKKADLIEGKTIKNIIKNGSTVGTGAVLGGVAGFGVAFFTKQNRWAGVIIGILVGSSVALVYAHNKKAKELKKKEEETTKTE